jgi:hypothetical protein
MANKDTLKLLEEFISDLDDIYGVYLDSNRGFVLNKEKMIRDQEIGGRITKSKLSVSELDKRKLTYGVGHPGKEGTYILHETTQKGFKDRNSKGGRNYITIGNMCVSQIYQIWEDDFRGRIAKSLGLIKNDIQSDIFGDIRLIRNSITHHRGIALKEISRCKLINYFLVNDSIEFTEKQIEEIIYHVKLEIDKMKNEKQ